MLMRLNRFVSTIAATVLVTIPAVADDCNVLGEAVLKSMPHEIEENAELVMQIERDTCALLSSGKVDELMDEYIAEHGIILLDGGGIAKGREAQRTMFKEWLGAGYRIVYEPADAKVSASEDMAWVIGAIRLTTPADEIELGKYVSVWEKEGDKWLNVIEMRNSNGSVELF